MPIARPLVLLMTTAAALAAPAALADPASGGELRATIANVKPDGGRIMVALYASADTYGQDTRTAAQQLTAYGSSVTAVFAGLPPGRYGVAVFQDADGDGRLSSTLLGLPAEPYGFSRDASAALGRPAFDALAVAVGEGIVQTTITLSP